MKSTLSFFESQLEILSRPGEIKQTCISTSHKFARDGVRLIRFEERKEIFSWVRPEEILFVKSADHYVKSLIQQGGKKKWMIRHCTLKEMFALLTHEHFIRLNRFYILNRNHFSYINENEKLLYLHDGSSIPIPHRISRFIISMLKY